MLPRLAHFYGLTPADVDAMTTREVSEFIHWLNEYDAAEREAVRRDGG